LAAPLVVMLCGIANADRVVLTDGRTIEGRITDLGNSVRVDTETGRQTIPRTKIIRIEKSTTTQSEFGRRLATVDRTDADALYALARWAREQGLAGEAKKLLAECIAADPDHEPSHRGLGHVPVDGRWYPPGDTLAIARGWRAAGLFDRATALLSTFIELTGKSKHRRDAIGMLAEIKVHEGAWGAARPLWAELAKDTRDIQERARLEARLAILDDNPDGMWVVLGRDAPESQRDVVDRPSGLHGLDEPWVMELALREEAKHLVATGDAALDRAQGAAGKGGGAEVDRNRAEAALRKANEAFTQAEAVSEGVAKGHRLELARRRIGLERHEAEWYAAQYDRGMESLEDGRENATAYRASLKRMVGQLKRVEAILEALLTVAAEYPDELDLEIEWTGLDLERVRGHREALGAKLDALR